MHRGEGPILKPLPRRGPSVGSSPLPATGVSSSPVSHGRVASRSRCRAVGLGVLALLSLTLLWGQLRGLLSSRPPTGSGGFDAPGIRGGAPPVASWHSVVPLPPLPGGGPLPSRAPSVAHGVPGGPGAEGAATASGRAGGGLGANAGPALLGPATSMGTMGGGVGGVGGAGAPSAVAPWPVTPAAAGNKCTSFFGNGFEVPFSLLPQGVVGDFRCA
jgi:hypothetical protein